MLLFFFLIWPCVFFPSVPPFFHFLLYSWKGDQSKSISLPAELLSRSASIRGFFLNHYIRQIPRHLLTLFEHVQQGKLLSSIDSTPFHGLESVADAIDHMYSGKNIGKVIVHLNPNEVPIRSRLWAEVPSPSYWESQYWIKALTSPSLLLFIRENGLFFVPTPDYEDDIFLISLSPFLSPFPSSTLNGFAMLH